MLTNGIPKTAMTQKQPIFSPAKLGFEQPFPKASLSFSSWWTNFLNIIISLVFHERGIRIRGLSDPSTFACNKTSFLLVESKIKSHYPK